MTATGQADLRTRATTGIAVAGLHGALLLLLLLARTDPPPEIPDFPPMLVELIAPQPALRTAPTVGGGGKPSAPSRTHTPPEPPLDRIEVLAPPVQAVEQPLVVGMSDTDPVQAARGVSGIVAGTGAGSGRGSGSGPGTGEGGTEGPTLIRGPKGATIAEKVDRAALRRSALPYAILDCRIRGGERRFDRCRVMEESVPGAGEVALRKAREFVFHSTRGPGRFAPTYDQTIGIEFDPLELPYQGPG
ncbi:hypothetical protein [Brevundimonas lutea]|uniref:hypothetical protein n=1 Tax=Brevundimonas lutea TaxID=2293980 RepID=UPI000F0392FB|nr:hypothetical protein [Brevundimonas lutea]